jgi:hypothetical protein
MVAKAGKAKSNMHHLNTLAAAREHALELNQLLHLIIRIMSHVLFQNSMLNLVLPQFPMDQK